MWGKQPTRTIGDQSLAKSLDDHGYTNGKADLHLSWSVLKSGEICGKCASCRWSSCGAGRSAAVGSEPGRDLNRWTSQSWWTSRSGWSLSARRSQRRRAQTPYRSHPGFSPRPRTHSDALAVAPSFLWGRPRPTNRGTGDGECWCRLMRECGGKKQMEKYIQVIADTQCTDKCLVFCTSMDLKSTSCLSFRKECVLGVKGSGCFFFFKSQETESKEKVKKE